MLVFYALSLLSHLILLCAHHPGRTSSAKSLYFSTITHISLHTTAINLSFTDVPLSWLIFGENWISTVFCQEAPIMPPISQKKNAAKLRWRILNVSFEDILPEKCNRYIRVFEMKHQLIAVFIKS